MWWEEKLSQQCSHDTCVFVFNWVLNENDVSAMYVYLINTLNEFVKHY